MMDQTLPPAAAVQKVSRFSTIRTRLILSFVVMVLLPTSITALVQALSGWLGERQRAFDQMQTVADYKEDWIANWTNSLKIELGNALIGENVLKNIQTLMDAAPDTPDYAKGREAYYTLAERFQTLKERSQVFEELFLMDTNGLVRLSTTVGQEGQIYENRAYVGRGLTSPFVNPPYFSRALNRTVIIAVYPVVSESGRILGLMAGRASMGPLDAILAQNTGLGETGVTYLVGSNQILLSGLDPELHGQQIRTEGVQSALTTHGATSGRYQNIREVPVLGVSRYLPELDAVLLAEQDQAESDRVTLAVLAVNLSVALASLLTAIVVSLRVTRSIAEPVSDLAETAAQISAGNLALSPQIDSEDEIGALAQAFNAMTLQLRGLIGNLEARVSERTAQLEKHARYLEASTEVSRATASILDPAELMTQAVDLIRDHFELYYTGLFIVDEKREWAELRAGTGEAGQAMLNRGHRLYLDRNSMIGWCIVNNQARVALNVGEDQVRIATAELPETRSEAALPLRSRGRVIGALTVQSSQPNAFDPETISVLQTMADQLAVALDNARLFAESNAALEAERRAYGDMSRIAWNRWTRRYPDLVFRSDGQGVQKLESVWYPEMVQAIEEGKVVLTADTQPPAALPEQARAGEIDGRQQGQVLALPIKVRGTIIGVIDTLKPAEAGPWTPEEIAVLETITEQLGVALDSARLYTETQQKAEQERMVAEITARIRQTLDVDTVLQTAASEIFQSLGLHDVTIRLRSAQDG